MTFTFVLAEKASYSVTVLCSALDVSRSGFYAWCTRPSSAHAEQDKKLALEVATLHEQSRRTYGSPRIFRDLRAKGIRTSEKRVARVMRSAGIAAKRRR